MVHRRTLLIASFLTLIAHGLGFAIRTKVLDDWGAVFGFTKSELGAITGGGLVGFGIVILIGSVLAEEFGYKSILILAFVLHVLSAIITAAAAPVFAAYGQDATYWCLFVGMFMFAVANGLCEAVINPLVATVYPERKTHYLNILHAGWPGGLMLGAMLAYCFMGEKPAIMSFPWEVSMSLFLIPTVMYGYMVIKEPFPKSEAHEAGVTFKMMLATFAAPMMIMLLVLHAMVGYVELGTDSWITNIMENVIQGKALLLFLYTSTIMFVLRFFAGPIVERINPLGLLFVSSILGCCGLLWLSVANAGIAVILAATVYGLGKTFLWPTMLGVVGERFPQGGALTMGAVGGIGMLSAGLLGGPGIGYKQDVFASEYLKENAPTAYERVEADKPNHFLFFSPITGLDGAKVSEVKESDPQYEVIHEANLYGGRMALRWTAVVPAMMAIGYLILIFYFISKGGYRVEVLHGAKPEGERYTGGVEGPIE